jgi:hypothetical protein
MYRGPRFRAIQAIMATFDESESASPPPAAEALDPDILTGSLPTTIRDAARARAGRLEVEALRARHEANAFEVGAPSEILALLDFAENQNGSVPNENVGMMGLAEYDVGNIMAQAMMSEEECPQDSDGGYFEDPRGFPSHAIEFALPGVSDEQGQYGPALPLSPTACVDVHGGEQDSPVGEADHGLNNPSGDLKQVFTEDDNEGFYGELEVYLQTAQAYKNSAAKSPPKAGGRDGAKYEDSGDFCQEVGGGSQAAGMRVKNPVPCWNIDPALASFTPLDKPDNEVVNGSIYQETASNADVPVSWNNNLFHPAVKSLEGQAAGAGVEHHAARRDPEVTVSYFEGESYLQNLLSDTILMDGSFSKKKNIEAKHENLSQAAVSNAKAPVSAWNKGAFLTLLQPPNEQGAEAIHGSNSGAIRDNAQSPVSYLDGGPVPCDLYNDVLAQDFRQVVNQATQVKRGINHGAAHNIAPDDLAYSKSGLPLTSRRQEEISGNCGTNGQATGGTHQASISHKVSPTPSACATGTIPATAQAQFYAPTPASGSAQTLFGEIDITDAEWDIASTNLDKGTGTGSLGLHQLSSAVPMSASTHFDNEVDNKLLTDFNDFLNDYENNSGIPLDDLTFLPMIEMCKGKGEAAPEGAGRAHGQGPGPGSDSNV